MYRILVQFYGELECYMEFKAIWEKLEPMADIRGYHAIMNALIKYERHGAPKFLFLLCRKLTRAARNCKTKRGEKNAPRTQLFATGCRGRKAFFLTFFVPFFLENDAEKKWQKKQK